MGSSNLSPETERIVFLDYLRVFAMFLVFGVHASESVYSDGTLNFLFKNEADTPQLCYNEDRTLHEEKS